MTFFQNLLKTVAWACVLALFAQISIKVGPIASTGQSLAVMLAGFVLGPSTGAATVVVYWLMGLAGLPVFADGASGLMAFQKASSGYLLAFLPTAWLAGWLGERGFGSGFLKSAALMAACSALLLVLGGLWLYVKLDTEKWAKTTAITWSLLPGAASKMAIGAVLIAFFEKQAWRKG